MSVQGFFDLDSTLIYSVRSAQTDVSTLVPVERYKGNWIAYMTPRAVDLLDELIKVDGFVPTTTRTVDQFQRINFSHKPKWAITCNGAVILKNGEEVRGWTRHVNAGLPRDRHKMFRLLGRVADAHGWTNRVVRDSFFYMVLPVDVDAQQRDDVHAMVRGLDSEEWVTSIQSRKIYLLPRNVDKAVAMREVVSLSGGTTSIASGDSRLDLRMMLEADYALRPSHGELWLEEGETLQRKIVATSHSGALAAEEILNTALALSLFF